MPRAALSDIVAFLTVERAQRHTRCRAAWRFAVGAQPNPEEPGGAARPATADAHDARRGAHRGWGPAVAGPRLDDIGMELADLGMLREKPAGTIRI
jgi:hypothetical protein